MRLFSSAWTKRAVMYLAVAGKYLRTHPSAVIGTKRSRRKDSHGLPAALSPLATPSKWAVRTHVVCSGSLPWLLPTPLRVHTPAGCGHGGTRYSKTSLRLQT
jgi:hypothetical protein